MTDLVDIDTERALLSAILLYPKTLNALLLDGLRPEHFATMANAKAFQAMVGIVDSGAELDSITFSAAIRDQQISGDPDRFAGDLYALTVDHDPLDLNNRFEYAKRLRQLHRRRGLVSAAKLINSAGLTGNMSQLEEAERFLTTPAEVERTTWTAEQRRDRFWERLNSPAETRWRWPFGKLNVWTGGGLRRKQIVLIGGWTAMGKTVIFDQLMEYWAGRQGLRTHAYINEMSEQERTDRTIARNSGVPFSRIYAGDLSDEQRGQVTAALDSVRVGVTECEGWSADEIARHIRWNRWDVAGIDVLHEIPHEHERDLAAMSLTLRAAAKQANCALLMCVHLNDQRLTGAQRPRPVLRDVRGSGMLVRGADIVLFVHRDDDTDGIPTMDGVLLAGKIRNGSPQAMGVRFEPERMRFLPVAGAKEEQ